MSEPIPHHDTQQPAPTALDYQILFEKIPGLYMLLTPDLHIITVSDAYARATKTVRQEIAGRHLFEVFPDDPNDPNATGVANLNASLQRVKQTLLPDTMAFQKYAIRRSAEEGGGFEERYWSPTNTPVLGPTGELLYIVHRAEDVTEFLRQRQQRQEAQTETDALRRHVEEMEAEAYRRGGEIQESNNRLRQVVGELEELKAQLEDRVQERTQELIRSNQALTREIEERRQAEATLRASEERFRLLVEGVREYAIIMLDQQGKVSSWNVGAERIHGYRGQEIIGHSYSRFFSEDDARNGLPEKELERAAELGTVDEKGWRIRKDGTRFWANGVLTALYDPNGNIRGFAKVARDLTAQRRADALLRSIVDAALDGILTVDSSGIIRSFNRASTAIFGYEATEAIGRQADILLSLTDEDGLPSRAGELPTFLSRQSTGSREVTGRRKDGSQFPLELRVSEFELDNERHFTVLARDITERRELEAQLRQAQKMEAVGQLAGGIAHDINNLLTVISGYSDFILGSLAPGDRLEPMLTEIRQAGERAAALTRQLLAFSRQQVMEPRVLDLNSLILNTERMLQRLIGEDVRLTTQLSPGLKPIKADPGQIDQVLMNLAINARDAMRHGGRLVIETRNVQLDSDFVSAHSGLTPGEYVMVSVSDNGSGMSAQVRSRVFEPFFTTKEVGQGTGLGLAVVHGIVNQNGGRILVASKEGVGTVFTLYFPVAGEPERPPSEDARAKPLQGTQTILLVEDDALVRKFSVLALEQYGYRVLKASDGEEALSLAAAHVGRIDLLVTDVVMPGMSGLQLAEAMCIRLPQMKVLYLSGYTDDAVARHGVSFSDMAFLQKPFTPAVLAAKVRAVLDE